ncbi:peptidase C13 family protein [Cooperia oncophora]
MICLLLVLIGTAVSSPLPRAQFQDDPPRSIYALLVAGSNGFNNYRHQADVAHAYHILIQHGVPADNIVTMMYDDVAFDPKWHAFRLYELFVLKRAPVAELQEHLSTHTSPYIAETFSGIPSQADVAHAYHILIQHGVPADNIVTMMYDDVAFDPKNPKPGELHNSPDGPDYRKGMTVDYRTTSVNKVVFQAVLTGDAVIAGAYPGSGRVLQSTKEDNVFVYYTDHGAYNLLGMPSGSPMTRSELAAYIQRARSAGKFHKLSVYIEACESGSMLAGLENDEFGTLR